MDHQSCSGCRINGRIRNFLTMVLESGKMRTEEFTSNSFFETDRSPSLKAELPTPEGFHNFSVLVFFSYYLFSSH